MHELLKEWQRQVTGEGIATDEHRENGSSTA